MSNMLIITLAVMLVCLFLKVPVFISILAGSLIYFVMNPDVSMTLFAQRMIVGTQSLSLLAIPFFCLFRCPDELFRCDKASDPFL